MKSRSKCYKEMNGLREKILKHTGQIFFEDIPCTRHCSRQEVLKDKVTLAHIHERSEGVSHLHTWRDGITSRGKNSVNKSQDESMLLCGLNGVSKPRLTEDVVRGVVGDQIT